MATVTTTPRKTQADPERPAGILWPIVLQVVLLLTLAGAAVWLLMRVVLGNVNGGQETHFVFRRLTDPLSLGFLDQFGVEVLALLLAGGVLGAVGYGIYLLGKAPGKGRAGRLLRALFLGIGCLVYLGSVACFLLFA